MIKCQNCATDNLDGSEYCDECGSRLAAAIPQPPPPPAFTRDSVTPKPATPYTPPPPAPVAVPPAPPPQTVAEPQPVSAPPRRAANPTVALRSPADIPGQPAASVPGVRARLVIQRGGRVGREFAVINAESLIGRWDADGGIFPDVDLDQDDAEAKVSRRHARILLTNAQFFIEDLGSTNGTFVNRGQRLLPGTRHPLNNGDEIIVGKTFLRFFIV
ncbi:MAG: FHA domain-containing protein [Blastocatellia bacterium]